MCFSSLTTSSASRRRTLRCLRFSDVSRPPSDTSRLSQRILVDCRSASPPRRRDLLPLCRRSTCRPMTLRTPRRRLRSPTWTPRLCFRARLPSLASTPPSTRSTRRRACSARSSSVRSTTPPRAACRSCCRTTRDCRILLPFSVWMSFRRTTSSSSRVRARCSASSASRSRLPRCSPAHPDDTSTLPMASRRSMPSRTANTTTSQRTPSTWLAASTRWLRRLTRWPRKWARREQPDNDFGFLPFLSSRGLCGGEI
mmetsp:Transcript_1669/g.3751  ORF Transcript_1669/g.3751 Transcript_1669/m.3751 type:complete len:255 (-) Transcript_1669:97-861(-)